MNLRDWKLRARALFSPNRVERELDDELSFHIERETQKLVAAGMSPADARATALKRFGPLPLAADECRDHRGTAFVDNTVRDVLYAFRTFKRAPLVAFTIVSTVALGLGLVAVVFTFLNTFLFRVDDVPDLHEMFAVERPRNADGERPRFTRAQFEALRSETGVFTDAYAELSDVDSRIDGRMMAGTLVTGNFFQVVGVNAVLGRTLTPADDRRLAGNPVMVLSYRGWNRVFGRDPAILGRQLLVNGAPYEVIGVMPQGFRGLTVGAPDYWAPLSLLGQFRQIHQGKEESVGLDIIGRLRPGLTRPAALARLIAWDSGPVTGGAGRAPNITLVPHRGTLPQPLEAVAILSPLFFAFGLILMIGCANVANLLLARAVARQREIGVRLSLGASRRRIVRQLLTESLLLALMAAAAGFAISRIVLQVVISTILASIPPDLGNISIGVPGADWRVALFMVFGAIAATVFFGLMPALQATRVEPVKTIRGEVAGDARPGRARNFLIGLQVSASALLLIASAVFLRSALASSTVDPGMRTSDTVVIEIVNEPKRAAMVEAVTADPVVAAVAASWPDTVGRPRGAFAETSGAKARVGYKFVTPEYFAVLDIPVVRGRGFTRAEGAGKLPVAIVSETTARELWPNADAIGQPLRLAPDPSTESGRADENLLTAQSFSVVGIARDVAGFRITDTKEAGVWLPISAAAAETSLIVRVHGDPERARQLLLDRLTLVDPNMGQVLTMRTMARMETYFLQIAFWTTLVLGGLALALTLSGLFSVLSYLVEQRAKEIGVRMALGATAPAVTRLVLSQSLRPVGFGLLIGGGLAAGLAIALLSTAGAGAIGNIVHVLDPIAYAGSLSLIIAACLLAAAIPAARAARLDPMSTLRQD
jgi:putative ABC transport system permease protein